MLLGKRPRPHIRRTTSMTGITVDLPKMDHREPSDHPNVLMNGLYDNSDDERFLTTMVSPRINQRRSSGDFLETAHFLRTCSLCKSQLVPSRDIYMYRGDTAFCSLECREKQMKQDERKDKCSSSINFRGSSSSSKAASASASASRKNETMAPA